MSRPIHRRRPSDPAESPATTLSTETTPSPVRRRSGVQSPDIPGSETPAEETPSPTHTSTGGGNDTDQNRTPTRTETGGAPPPPPPVPGQAPPPATTGPPRVLAKTKRDPTGALAGSRLLKGDPKLLLRTLAGKRRGAPAQEQQALTQEAAGIVQDCVSASATTLEPAKAALAFLLEGAQNILPDEEREALAKQLVEGLFDTTGHLPDLVAKDPAFCAKLLTFLTAPSVPGMVERDRYRRVRRLIDEMFASDGLADFVTHEPDLVVLLLKTAVRMAGTRRIARDQDLPDDFVGHILDRFGDAAPAMAAAVVRNLWKGTAQDLGPDVVKWLFDGDVLTVDAWNNPDNELAARGINLLWVSGDYERICVLIKKGVDCTLSAKAWDGTKREGVWTGYVQPLTHVLGKYVKPIELLDTINQGKLEDVDKVRGAKKIIEVLQRLPQPPRILLDYPTIQDCQMVAMFSDQPGTVWGFEDVRLPYVQAARETAHGQQPLRMLDMWEAIVPALDSAVYPKLIANPKATVKDCVDKGIEQVRQGIRERRAQYEGMVEDEYVKGYETQCTSYLTFLASRIPYMKYQELPKGTGKDPAKLMPSFACKAGIWWAKSQNRPLYYCIDGLNMQDAANYKAFKTREINAYLSALDTSPADVVTLRPFQEVITLAEVREILLNWDQLSTTVRFVEMGKILDTKDAHAWVSGWRAQMRETDNAAPMRQWREQDTILNTAYELQDDQNLWPSLQPREVRDCVREAKLLEVVSPSDPDMLRMTLDEACPTLRRLGLVPDRFVELFMAVLDADPDARPAALSELRNTVSFICTGLRKPLGDAIDRLFGPASPPVPSDSIIDLDLDPSPRPGIGTPPGTTPMLVPTTTALNGDGGQNGGTGGGTGAPQSPPPDTVSN